MAWKLIKYTLILKCHSSWVVVYVEYTALAVGVFVDTYFHASRQAWHNKDKQLGIPTIWGSGANGQLGQKSTTGLVAYNLSSLGLLELKVGLGSPV